MNSRRDFLKKTSLLAAGGTLAGSLDALIARARAIDPSPGSTWRDAEHVVILMQENRSFDHAFGSLRGVRGYNDPRAVTLPNGNPVWFQSNHAGETYAPFRLNLRDTRATWMSSLPHSWVDQTDARNHGHHNGWLDAKHSGNKAYADLPLTLGFYNREDLPFYYALADAFTICDQAFCSSLTGTTPNRLYLWTGTIRSEPSVQTKANVRNEDVDYGAEAGWTTFPERLEDHGISWKVYQNELSLASGLEGESDAWLSNFTDNPLEWFRQYHVRFSETHRAHQKARVHDLTKQIQDLSNSTGPKRATQLQALREELKTLNQDLAAHSPEAFASLAERERRLHAKAFTTNRGDRAYRELTELPAPAGSPADTLTIPKGDTLHQFRSDVRGGTLPTVSWIVAPENFSDHPGAPWYGAWYLSEVLEILTQDPAVWRKTVFILCYDENDGYFDHVPPFVAPDPERPETGRASAGIDTLVEQVRLEQEQARQQTQPESPMRAGPIGLGFRVPLLVASPWSRGGAVCSQVFDHTSILQFLEQLLSHKTGKTVREPNISSWRRAICGDLTSVFQPWHGEPVRPPAAVAKEPFFHTIHQARLREIPHGFHRYTAEEIETIRAAGGRSPGLPRQEAGVRPSRPLPYALQVQGRRLDSGSAFELQLTAGARVGAQPAAGAPFRAYRPGATGPSTPRDYSVASGDTVMDTLPIDVADNGAYRLHVHGPNGFFREFQGNASDPRLIVTAEPFVEEGKPGLRLRLRNLDATHALNLTLRDAAYGAKSLTLQLAAGADEVRVVTCDAGRGWYDLVLSVEGSPSFLQRLAGRIETGMEGISDPAMA